MSYHQLAQHIRQELRALDQLPALERHSPGGQELVSRLAARITQRGAAEQALAARGNRPHIP